jgi:hypothetical protein
MEPTVLRLAHACARAAVRPLRYSGHLNISASWVRVHGHGTRWLGVQIVQRPIRKGANGGPNSTIPSNDEGAAEEPVQAIRMPAPPLPSTLKRSMHANKPGPSSQRGGEALDARAVESLWLNSVGLIRESRATSRRCISLLKADTVEQRQMSLCADLIINERALLDQSVQHFDAICEGVAARISLAASAPTDSYEDNITEAARLYAHLFAIAMDIIRAVLNNAASADKLLQVHKRHVERTIGKVTADNIIAFQRGEAGRGNDAVVNADMLFADTRSPIFKPATGAALGSAVWSELYAFQKQGAIFSDKVSLALNTALQQGALPPYNSEEIMFEEAADEAVSSVLVCVAQVSDFLRKIVTINPDSCQSVLLGIARSKWIWGRCDTEAAVQAVRSRTAASQVFFHLGDKLAFLWNSTILRYRQYGELEAAVAAHRHSQLQLRGIIANLHATLAAHEQALTTSSDIRAPLSTDAEDASMPLELVELEPASARSFSELVPPQVLRSTWTLDTPSVSTQLFRKFSSLRNIHKNDKSKLVRLCKRSTCALSLVFPLGSISEGSGRPSFQAQVATHSPTSEAPLPATLPKASGSLPDLDAFSSSSSSIWNSDASDADDVAAGGVTPLAAASPGMQELFSLDPSINFFAVPVDEHLRLLRASFKKYPPLDKRGEEVAQFVRHVEETITDMVRSGMRPNPSIGRMMLSLYLDSDRRTQSAVQTESLARQHRPHPAVRLHHIKLEPATRPFIRDAALWILRLKDIGGHSPDAKMMFYLLLELTARCTSRIEGEAAAWVSDIDSNTKLPPTITPQQQLSMVQHLRNAVPGDKLAVQVLVAFRDANSGVRKDKVAADGYQWIEQLLQPFIAHVASAHRFTDHELLALLYLHLRADDAIRAIWLAAQACTAAKASEPTDMAVAQQTVDLGRHVIEAASTFLLELLTMYAERGLLAPDLCSSIQAILLERIGNRTACFAE